MNTFVYAFAGGGEPFIGYMADVIHQDNIVFAVTSTLCFIGGTITYFVNR